MEDARIKYSDIFDQPHHVSSKRPRMSRLNRAAQIAPFDALTGFDDLIKEASRQTGAQVELDESQIEELNKKLVRLLNSPTPASFTHFRPDPKKSGCEYLTHTGSIRRYDPLSRSIELDNGEVIKIERICEIEDAE